MEKLKMMRGSKERAEEVKQWLKSQGVEDVENAPIQIEGLLFYVIYGDWRFIHYDSEILRYLNYEIVELPEHQFKPFERVLTRDGDDEKWTCNLFSHYDENDRYCPFVCVWNCWQQCIPYEGNEHLLGTTDSPKGGEQ